jgi:hypothetical protein
MFEIEKINHFAYCQVCGSDASENIQDKIYGIRIMNKNHQGAEIRLCSKCCSILSKLTEEPDKRLCGVKMMSINELD